MSASVSCTNSENNAITEKRDDIAKLALVRQDRIGDILFLIGTLLAFYANYLEEQSIVQPESRQSSNQYQATSGNTIEEIIALFNWIFLAASILFADSSSKRLNAQSAEISKNTSPSGMTNLIGSQIATVGSYVKLAGFALSAIGSQIKADNPSE